MIITGDIHLRDTKPTCRTDDYLDALGKKLDFVRDLQKKYVYPVCDSGDLFDKWKPSPFLLQWAISKLPEMITVPGNHDLPQHNIDLYNKSGLSVLEAAGVIQVLRGDSIEMVYEGKCINVHGVPWGSKPNGGASKEHDRNVLIWHTLAYIGKPPYPGCDVPDANYILDAYPEYDLVITGHYHKSFVIEKDGRVLVNPGSLMRSTADQIDYEPKIYIWDSLNNSVRPVYLPIEKGVVSREHIDVKNERDERISVFVEKLNENIDVSLSFEDNLERFMKKNKTRKELQEKIWEIVNVHG